MADQGIPAPPAPEPGPTFIVSNGILDIADHGAAADDDLQRLGHVLPILREQVAACAESLRSGNRPHAHLLSAVEKYEATLQGDTAALNYDLVAARGLILGNAEAAARRQMADRLEPELDDATQTALSSILDLHGVVVQSTAVGRALLDAAANYRRTPAQEKEFSKATKEIAAVIVDRGLASPAAGELITTTAAQIGTGAHPTRSSVVGAGVIRNASVALIGGALLAVAPSFLLGAAGWAAILIVGEGVKKSKLGQAASRNVTEAIDDPEGSYERMRSVALEIEGNLRTVSEGRRELRWLQQSLNWIASNTAPAESSVSPAARAAVLRWAKVNWSTGHKGEFKLVELSAPLVCRIEVHNRTIAIGMIEANTLPDKNAHDALSDAIERLEPGLGTAGNIVVVLPKDFFLQSLKIPYQEEGYGSWESGTERQMQFGFVAFDENGPNFITSEQRLYYLNA